MAIRINPQSGLMEMVKEREATSAVLTEALRPKTAVEGLKDTGPISLESQPKLFQEQPRGPAPVAKFDIPDIQKGRELSASQIEQREKFASMRAQQDAARFAEESARIRESERVKPISELREDAKDFEDYTNDGFGEALKRSDKFTQLFQDKLESGATVTGAYLSAAQALPIAMGLSPQETGEATGQSINPNSTKGILFDPKGFNAGKMREDNVMQVDPMFGRTMGIATEKFILQNQYNVRPNQETDTQGLEDFAEKALAEVEQVTTDEGKLRRGIGNQQLGREIFRAWKREQNAMRGRPTDEYTETGVTADQFETMGTLAKEMYHAANPELYSRESDSFNRTVEYKLTPVGATALAAAEASSPAVFAGYEVKPSTLPRGKQQLTEAGLGESRQYRKAKTTSVVNQKINEVEEARDNMNSVAHGVDPLRKKIYFQLAIEVLTQLKDSERPPAAGDLLKIGPSKMIAFKGELDKKLLEDPNTDYNPSFEAEKQVTKFIETLNTIAKYSNQANYLDFAVQELQTRMHATQTRFNPQLVPWIRFVTGGLNPPSVNPNSNSDETLMFKEIMAKHFIKGADKLLPENRVKAFDTEWNSPNHGIFASYIQDGKSISESLLNAEQDQKYSDAMKRISLNDKGISIPPELATMPRLKLSPGLKSKAIGEELEGLNLIEGAHELFKFEQAQKSNTSFKSNIAVELDGKTHGPASNLMQLGSMKAAYRAGVLRKAGATKNLDSIPVADLYQGAETDPDLQAGDIRDAMQYFMLENGQVYAENFVPNRSLQPSMYKILELATKDRDNFLKKPPMTLAYGQLLKNLRQAITEVIFTGPSSVQIRQIVNSKEIGAVLDSKIQASKARNKPSREDIVADFLHDILADSIDAELDPGVVQVGQLLRANNVVAMLSDEVMKVKNAIGVDNYIGAKSTMMKEEVGNTGVMFGEGSPVARAGAVPLYSQQPSGSAIREGKPGGWGRGRIIPAVIQGIDGAWMNRMFTGNSFRTLKRSYMLPIMDAVKTDLSGARKVRELANKNWWDVIEEYSYVNSLMEDWTPGAIQRFRTKLENIGDTSVDISMDNEYRGFYYLLHDTEETGLFSTKNLSRTLYDTMEHPPRKQGEKVKSYEFGKKERAERLAEALMPNAKAFKGRQINSLTGAQLLKLFDNIIGPRGLNVTARNRQTIDEVGKAKKQLTEAAKDSRKLQIDM